MKKVMKVIDRYLCEIKGLGLGLGFLKKIVLVFLVL